MNKYCPDCGDPLTNPMRCGCGWRDKDTAGDVPHWPGRCGREHCENPTAVAFLSVRDPSNTVRVGAATEFMDGKQLRGGYTFVRWITRCSECHAREMEGSGKEQLRELQL